MKICNIIWVMRWSLFSWIGWVWWIGRLGSKTGIGIIWSSVKNVWNIFYLIKLIWFCFKIIPWMQSNLSFYIILSTRVLFGMLTDSDYGINACFESRWTVLDGDFWNIARIRLKSWNIRGSTCKKKSNNGTKIVAGVIWSDVGFIWIIERSLDSHEDRTDRLLYLESRTAPSEKTWLR